MLFMYDDYTPWFLVQYYLLHSILFYTTQLMWKNEWMVMGYDENMVYVGILSVHSGFRLGD